MHNLEKTEKINNLLELYGSLLTKKQCNIMNMYYCYDLSLSEIAENENISRAAVYDLIKRTCNLLEDYENKLNLYKKRKELESIIVSLPEDIRKKIEKII